MLIEYYNDTLVLFFLVNLSGYSFDYFLNFNSIRNDIKYLILLKIKGICKENLIIIKTFISFSVFMCEYYDILI